ncbi:MAG: TlyA family RNA methyltransferase [Clostridia bacterium]|nr:TlyA family RNA methyltransferase [Clostridia bacterium]
MAEKLRIDVALTEWGFCTSRREAQALIIAGEVRVNGVPVQKASQTVTEADAITLMEKLKYVSRGGLKLEKAMSAFPIQLENKICLDIGASTGGFTDCMLQNRAKKVYAIDVGHGQLAYVLRNDERVVCMEQYNARNLKLEDVEPADFASIDVSFISLKLILQPLFGCLKDNGQTVALIKPQFEAGREKVGKGGVVRKKETRLEVCSSVYGYAVQAGFSVHGLEVSPILGPKGNEEYLIWLHKGGVGMNEAEYTQRAQEVVSGH